jgi:hypothetical protein
MRILLLWINDARVKTCHADLGSGRVPVFGAELAYRWNPTVADRIVWQEKVRKVQACSTEKRCKNKV